MQHESSFWPTATRWMKRVFIAEYALMALLILIVTGFSLPRSPLLSALMMLMFGGIPLAPVLLSLWQLASRRVRQTGFGAVDVLLGLVLAETALFAVYACFPGMLGEWGQWVIFPYMLLLFGMYCIPVFCPWPLAAVLALFGTVAWLMKKRRDRP